MKEGRPLRNARRAAGLCRQCGDKRSPESRVYCEKHLAAERARTGVTFGTRRNNFAPIRSPMKQRIEAMTMHDLNSGCWIWLGSVNKKGYARITLGPRSEEAHRASYEAFVGEIPAGLDLDHLCRVTCCVNPKHLEPVTARENVLRGTSLGATCIRNNRCAKGHEYTPGSFYSYPGEGRICRQCAAARSKRYNDKKRQREAMSA